MCIRDSQNTEIHNRLLDTSQQGILDDGDKKPFCKNKMFFLQPDQRYFYHTIPDHPYGGKSLGDYSCPGSAGDSHLKLKDKKQIQQDVDQGGNP